MRQTLAPTHSTVDLACRETVFTLSEARRALPYVARVVRDAAESFRVAQFCRIALEDHISTTQRLFLDERRDNALRRLNAAIDDCNTVGADLLDISRGMVRFNALVSGRLVSLVWRLGEPIDDAWDELADEF